MFKEATKLTPLYHLARQKGARMVTVGRWQVAADFGDVTAESRVCRTAVGLADFSHWGRLIIEGKAAMELLQGELGVEALGIGGGTAVSPTTHLYRLRPDRFLLNTAAGEEQPLLATLNRAASQADSLISVGDSSHGLAQLLLVGPHAARLLSRLCGLNFHDAAFPTLTAKQSSVGKTTQTILRHDFGSTPAYSLLGAASLAVYLWGVVLEAGADLGVRVVGETAVSRLRE
ncbi:MAG: sarcosine oxidase subunit gamma family protein [Chloroflexota bacterium]